MAPSEPSDAWTRALEETYPAALPSAPAALSERSPCPACGGHLAPGDLEGVAGLSAREQRDRAAGRFGAEACEDCHALFPWET